MNTLQIATSVLALGAASVLAPAQTQACSTWSAPETIYAGQTIPVGTWMISNDADNLYVDVQLNTTGDCSDPLGPRAAVFANKAEQLKLWLGTDLSNLPGGGTSRPPLGQFPFKATVTPGSTSYQFVIAWEELSFITGWGTTPGGFTNVCGMTLHAVLHLDLDVDKDCNGSFESGETAFGGPDEGPGNAWWFLADYTICCNNNPPPPQENCETAFAKGTHVFASNRRANPENMDSLDLTRQRWGWAINLDPSMATSTPYYYDIWAGAGLNKTDNGWLVGTLEVIWTGTEVTVTYNLTSPYAMNELHVYAGDTPPTTIAPGQYGTTEYFEPAASTWSTTLPVSDTGTDGIWLIAHSVVCVVTP